MQQSALRVVLFLLVVVFIYLQYVLWFADDGIWQLLRLKKELAQQVEQNEILKQHNQELFEQVARLKKDPEVTEAWARDELGMIKKGEKFYQIISGPR